MNEKRKDYFAYGSNMDTVQMLERCPNAQLCGTAVLSDYKFALDEVGYATVIPCRGAAVPGVLWRINAEDEKALDRCEGVHLGCYKKETLTVSPKGCASKLPVLVYTSLRGENRGRRKDNYIERIVTAAAHFGFDNGYVSMLKDIWVGYANEDYRIDGKTSYVFEKAIGFAADAHHGTCRKGTDIPYILHPLEAASIVGTMTSDPCILAAAVLHDVVEDTSVTIGHIRLEFGERIADLVAAESENKRENICAEESWLIRKREAVKHLDNAGIEAKMIALGDKLSNMRAIKRDFSVLGNSLWERFNVKDPALHGRYYGALAESLSDLSEYPAWQEYRQLVDEVFGGTAQ